MKKYFSTFSISLLSVFFLFECKENGQSKVNQNLLKSQEQLQLRVDQEKREKKERRKLGFPDKHTELQKLMKTGHGQDGPTYEGGYQLKEFKKLQAEKSECTSRNRIFFY